MSNAQEINDALAGSYMLVELELRSWSGRKTDREASTEVISNKGATKDSGRFVKNLFASADAELAEVHRNGSLVRAFVYSKTLPWSANTHGVMRGARLIAATQTIEFLRELNQVKREYDMSVQKLVDVWPQRITEAMTNLNGLAKASDYPDAADVAAMFGVTVDLRPVPSLADFSRVNVPPELALALGQRHAQQAEVQLGNAMGDLKGRLLDELNRMARQLGKAAAGEKTRLYDSLVTNLQGLVGLVRTMNVSGNAELNALADKIERELLAQPVEVYRNSKAKAEEVASAAQQIAVDAAMENIWKM